MNARDMMARTMAAPTDAQHDAANAAVETADAGLREPHPLDDAPLSVRRAAGIAADDDVALQPEQATGLTLQPFGILTEPEDVVARALAAYYRDARVAAAAEAKRWVGALETFDYTDGETTGRLPEYEQALRDALAALNRAMRKEAAHEAVVVGRSSYQYPPKQ